MGSWHTDCSFLAVARRVRAGTGVMSVPINQEFQ